MAAVALRHVRIGALAVLLAGCAADRPMRTPDTHAAIKAEMAATTPPLTASKAVPAAVSESLAEPGAVAKLTRRLEEYLRGHTEILVDPPP